MKVEFADSDGEVIFKTQTNDVSGLLAAAKGEAIMFGTKRFTYTSHVLNHYELLEIGMEQQLTIYMKR
ncbi:thymidylate synthase [Viridibacillus sp. NPDC096237]|uniref:thymidylate synthase n=1 Tax=Viridibacillus sp. NPDC096237 TaxID=3390721 RepID=UPI003D036406